VSQPAFDPHLVLRHALHDPVAVRIGRPRATQSQRAVRLDDRFGTPAADALPLAHACIEEALRQGSEEGLRQGRAEGLRLGAEEGRRSGYEEGLARGREAAQEETRRSLEAALAEAVRPMQEKAQRLASIAVTLEASVASHAEVLEDQLVALCLDILGRVVGPCVLAPAGLRGQVQQLLSSSGRTGELTVHVHPDDLQLLLDMRDAGGTPAPTQFVADPRITLGGCILSGGGAGEIDARLETVLEECKAALLEARRSAARSASLTAPPAGAAS